eukprot:TRINITY_DN1987_c0_g1_i2.p1 TRINITY_DN1987_c0_g1~~TRINITY_DN1987_c0_g1_i2.p1  ORF type:complete len:400 (-),score=64.28 TRINITY_DN1987_c0_g1_i2:21-1220(-)
MGSNKFPINLCFKNPAKDSKMLLILKNSLKTDIRIYKLEITVHPKPVKATLEFRVPARKHTTQDIPIINNTDKDWTIKVLLQGDPNKNGNLFTCNPTMQKEFIVKRKSPGYFPITFTPKWLCTACAKLELTNPLTNDKFEYELKGFGEEPMAEDHIVIDCNARETTTYSIKVQNPYDTPLKYTVQTDLINATGAKKFTVDPKSTGLYTLSITPVLSGQYTGSITFYETEDIYIWYTILLNTKMPKADKTLEINSIIRQAAVVDIELKNPLSHPITYDVLINGEGLIGQQQCLIDSNSVYKYELIYSPLYIGKQKGSVAFINEQLGELWYDLTLTSEEQTPIRLPVLKTELGKVDVHKIKLENPFDKNFEKRVKRLEIVEKEAVEEQLRGYNVLYKLREY